MKGTKEAARVGPAGEAGYSLAELLAVMGIMTALLLVAIPNVIGIHESYLLRSNTTGVVSYLKMGRMKAVGNNYNYTAELDSVDVNVKAACGGNTGTAGKHWLAVYRDVPSGSPKVELCFVTSRRIDLKIVPDPGKNRVGFKSNGTCANGVANKAAPNWFVLRSRNNKMCQLACVNPAGMVAFNKPYEVSASAADCKGSDNKYNTTIDLPASCTEPL